MNESTHTADGGGIQANGLYTIGEINRRLGLGPHAIRSAKRRGLRVLKIGRGHFLLGRDLIAYALRIDEKAV